MYTSDSAQIPVHVFHNQMFLRFSADRPYPGEYQPGDPVVHVFSITVPRCSDHRYVCEDVYQLLNTGENPENGKPDARAADYRNQGHRSLSVSDLLCVDGSWYSCDAVGFSKAEPPRVIGEPADELEPVSAPALRWAEPVPLAFTEPMLGRKTHHGHDPIWIRTKGRSLMWLRQRANRLVKRRERSTWKSQLHDLDLW